MSEDRQRPTTGSLISLPGAELEKAAAGVLEKAGGMLVDGSSGFVGNLFNLALGDRVREWRTRNMIRGAAKTAVVLKDMGVSLEAAKAIPTMEIYSIFTGMSEASDPEVSDLWAGLLASRMDPANNKPFDKLIAQTLGVLNGVEARILDFLFTYERRKGRLSEEIRNYQIGNIVTLSEEYSEASKRLQKEVGEEITAIYEAHFHDSAKEEMESGLNSLLIKGLIYHQPSALNTPKVTKRTYVGDTNSQRFDFVDPQALERSLQDLRRKIDKANLDPRFELVLFRRYEANVLVPFRLTLTGHYLLSQCKPAESSPEQSQ